MPPKTSKKTAKKVELPPRKKSKRKVSTEIMNDSPDEDIIIPKESEIKDEPSSDSDSDFSDLEETRNYSGYLHDKIGIFVKDDSGSTIDKSQLVKLLPADFGVVIVEYSDEERCDKVPGFSCSLRLSIRDKDTILRWLKLFEQKTCTVYRVDSTFKCDKSKKLVFKKNFRCQNNQYNHPNRNKENTRKKRIEHTACPAKISLTIKNHEMQRTTDLYLKEYPAVINIRFTHNHTFRTDKDYHKPSIPKIIRDDKKQIDEFKVIVGNVVVNSLSLKDIEHKEINIENTSLLPNGVVEKQKHVIINNDWNDIICDDVFNEKSNQSICLQKEPFNYSETLLQIDRFCNTIKQKIAEKSDVYHLPVISFIESFNSMKTDTELASALSSFGCFNENSNTACKKESYTINVHDTSIQAIPIPDIQAKVFTNAYKIEKDDRIFVTTEHPYFRL